ncbi:meiotic nuclear division protein 1 [Dimargaris cristalligena]|uniref:Meiotic nuclear division protein 1 n=1 Tax=Dimargaris cristalligena TaxID=215637 RepID=A0A4P9ZX40_9FUNG|nr:meiotic nuclear division protein 1 [Dimargaris cristalligena]|eukprot:RKP38255.1 meiotic nuclear division protein 1 [Dimargaris cristalligena]
MSPPPQRQYSLLDMSKRGLSLAEKRQRLEEIFYETKDFFQLKELEKIAPKTKGIVVQSVKEVLQSLVDDNIVQGEKIGTSNYFWSFPSTALKSRKRKIDDLEKEFSQLQKRNEDLKSGIETAQQGREDSNDRTELLRELEDIEKLHSTNKSELHKFSECDPVLLKAKDAAAEAAKDSANRWTDNIFILQSYCQNQFQITNSDFSANFGIPEDFDSIP